MTWILSQYCNGLVTALCRTSVLPSSRRLAMPMLQQNPAYMNSRTATPAINGDNPYDFKGYSAVLPTSGKHATNRTGWNIWLHISHVYGMSNPGVVNYDMTMGSTLHQPRLLFGNRMKLSLILVSIVAYVVLATIWICYAELVAIY